MKLFRDVVTNCEVFSDAFKIDIVDDAYYVIHGKIVAQSNDIDDSKIGGNKSEEAGSDDVDSSTTIACDLITSFQLDETVSVVSKKDVKEKVSDYGKKLAKHLKEQGEEDKVDAAKSTLLTFLKFVRENHDKFKYYAGQGDGFDVDGVLLALETINEDPDKGDQVGDSCKLYCPKAGLVEEKL